MDKHRIDQLIKTGRDFMKMPLEDPEYQSDQELKCPQPSLVKTPISLDIIDLPTHYHDLAIENDFLKIINHRKSDRIYSEEKMSLLAVSYLLWCTQGIKEIRGNNYATIRTVPCGGARHEFECYLSVQNVNELKDGLYHYLPMTHQLEFLSDKEDLKIYNGRALGGQDWANKANLTFYYSVVGYRCEWRYGIYAHRVALIDAGHISENLYLAATSIHLGGCAVGYIDQSICDEAFGLDGHDEFIFYAFPVGTIRKDPKQSDKDPYDLIMKR
ncbi:MAG: SagB-type dehydrogenase domain-containing protein [Erysipelotrichaceae bacterium]|nr:MAG: SagB-type dehydrogenase domain-containing [Erysipelotrichaceae bacterium]TXT18327.1 MAG: SagB-type dehydrogenase domain-containing protein [Erysipelotrichaceae bacterium]